MKITADIGDELAWLREELETVVERALSEVSSGGRPEFAAGFYACADTLVGSIEGRYAAWIEEQRAALRSVRK